ncbi:MAG: M14 family zinc carboxypeptidase, partial [Anaerolineales bacterium]
MHNSSKKYSVTAAVVIFALLLASIPTLVFASRGSYAPLPPAIAPEPYPNSEFYPAIVYLSTSNDLQVLYRMNIDIDGLQPVNGASGAPAIFTPSNATVYINPAQAIALSQVGLTPKPIQNEGYRSFLAYGPGSGAPNAWPTFDEYVSRMQNLEAAYPDIVKLEVIGYSVQGRGLYCMEITDNPGVSENEPEFKYTATHHGDETTGIEMTMRLAELLANGYGSDPLLTDLVDKLEIWLCPIYNPDGYVNGTRYNAHGQDLNRDFPDRFTDPIDDPAGREPETQAFMNFGYAHRFVMGANYHTGAQVLNYPWDAIADPDYPEYAPDDQLFIDFGIGYTSRNPDLWGGGFPQGITRGWQWYMIYGGMQDWAYNYRGEHHVTLEISFTKSPPFNQMDSYWEHNREAMLWWMQQAWTGLNGEVLDARDSTSLDATLTLVGRDVPNTILTDPEIGDYHRVISPGSYTLNASAACYQNQSSEVSVISGTITTQDFYLTPMVDLSPSKKTASIDQAFPGDVINYQLRVDNSCLSTTATLTDSLPSSVTWTGYLTATQGIPIYNDSQILWTGEVLQNQPITITYSVSVNQCLAAGSDILNTAELFDGIAETITRTALVEVNNAPPSLPDSPSPIDAALNQPITTTLAWAPSIDLNCDAITYD